MNFQQIPDSRLFLQKPTVPQKLHIFYVFYETQRLINVFTTVPPFFPILSQLIQSTRQFYLRPF